MMNPLMRMLFVDDNPGDRDLAREALEQSGGVQFYTACDGEEAMAFLRRCGAFENAPSPHVIMLDLNMPRKGGLDVLREIKADDVLRIIPVIIFSSSTAAGDLHQAYHASANAYVVKPSTLDGFMSAMQQIEHFWQKVATVIQ